MTNDNQHNVLQRIIARTEREVVRRKRHNYRVPSAETNDERRSAVRQALSRKGAKNPRVIAEIKFRSPSAGLIRARTPGALTQIAKAYVQGGASALSVLTDRQDFDGTILDIRRAASAVSAPVLFKGFVVDPMQIDLARHVGASMVLLIVRALTKEKVDDLIAYTLEQGLEPVVEAADAKELELALKSGAHVIGVNARDLRTFEVDSSLALELVREIPKSFISVYMSGIKSAHDVQLVRETNVDAVLIGEVLMRAADPARELQKILGAST